MRTGTVALAMLLGCLLACGSAHAAATLKAGRVLRLSATTTVTVTLPAEPAWANGRHFYRNAAGDWVALTDLKTDAGTVTFTLTPAQIPAAGTTVVLGKPEGLDLTDTIPPKISKALIDDHAVAWPPGGVDLGWIDVAPKSVALHIADDQSEIDATSLSIAINGRRLAPGAAGLRFELDRKDAKSAVLLCDLAALLGEAPQGTVRIAIACDDQAIDERRLETWLAFTASGNPRITLSGATAAANGIKVVVDSTFSGYENIACLVDGTRQTPGSTTRGATWASAETAADHWACLLLPASKRVAGLEIAWANYSSTFWTSARYDIMTWDGSQWQRALRVQQNPEGQTSRHEFAPRSTDRVLIWVPAGGNHPRRPDMTWITELKVIE